MGSDESKAALAVERNTRSRDSSAGGDEFKMKCGKAEKKLKSRNVLHQHLKDAKHHVVEDEQNTDSIEVESEREDRIGSYRQAQITHYIGSQMMSGCDVLAEAAATCPPVKEDQ